MKGVLRPSTICGRIGKWLNHLVEFDDGSGPTVGDDQWESIGVRGTLMDEVDIESVDFGGELVKPIESRFPCPPVVSVGPVAGEVANVIQRDALAPVVDALCFGPPRVFQAHVQVSHVVVGNSDAEWCDVVHAADLPSSVLVDRIGMDS
jgi:hypothetical protein